MGILSLLLQVLQENPLKKISYMLVFREEKLILWYNKNLELKNMVLLISDHGLLV